MKKIVSLIFDKIRIRHFVIVFLLSLPLSAYLLRQNNLTMLELRDEVLAVDEETGDFAQVQPHLETLRSYVLGHMNADPGTVELPGVFNTAVERLRLEAEQSGSANGSIYAEAQRVCEDPNILLPARAQCIQDYVLANSDPGSDAVTELQFPDKALFSYSFISPSWSPDLAGFSVVFSVLSGITTVFLVLTRVLVPLLGRIIERDPLE